MKTGKKIICIVLSILMLFPLSSCGKEEKAVMKLKDTVITEGMYQYWLCSYKAQFMNQYSDMSDSDEFWNQKVIEDTSAEEFLTDLVNEYVMMNLVSMYLFDEYGLKISSEDKENAANIVNDLKEASDADSKSFNAVLSQYGVNEKTLKEIYLDEFKSTYVYNYVFENNVKVVTDAERQEYLENNYVRVRHIYINDEYNYDESYYDSDDNFVKVPLDAEKQKAQDEKTANVRKALEDGKDFDDVYKEYSEEKAYDNGYYICDKTEGLPDGFVLNAFSLEIGETAEFKSNYGTHFIKRLEMNEGAWNDKANEDFFGSFSDDVYNDVFMKMMREYFDMIETDNEALDAFSIREALPNWSYQY